MATLLSAYYVSGAAFSNFHGLNHLPYFIKSKLLLIVRITIMLYTIKEEKMPQIILWHTIDCIVYTNFRDGKIFFKRALS